MAPAWMPEFTLSHENAGKRHVLGIFLIVIGCQYSIETITMSPVCPGPANNGCGTGYNSCNAPCNVLPQADPIPTSGSFQDVENRGTRHLYKDCNRGVGPLSSYGGNANSVVRATDATCMVVGCKPAQCLRASYDCKRNSPRYPPFAGQGGATTASPGSQLNQEVKVSLSCVDKVWQTDQQPFAWLAFFIFEVTGVYLLFTRGRKHGEEDINGKQIVSTLVLMYGLYVMGFTVQIQLSCPGHTLTAGTAPMSGYAQLFPGAPANDESRPGGPFPGGFTPQKGKFYQTLDDPWAQYQNSEAGCIRDYPTGATAGYWHQNQVTTTTTAPSTTVPPTPAPTPGRGPNSYNFAPAGLCASGSPSPFAMGLQSSLTCVNLGCGPKQCIVVTQSCDGENGGRTTTTTTTAAPSTTAPTTTLGPSAFANIGTANNRVRCMDATPSAAVTSPLRLFYCILLILVGLFNLFFSSCQCSMPSMPRRGPTTRQQLAEGSGPVGRPGDYAPPSAPSNTASVPSNPTGSAWPDFCANCGKSPGGAFCQHCGARQ